MELTPFSSLGVRQEQVPVGILRTFPSPHPFVKRNFLAGAMPDPPVGTPDEKESLCHTDYTSLGSVSSSVD
jgi:hypothetical protein